MKDIYYPDNEDILEWLASGAKAWPAGDWDLYVLQNDDHDFLVFQLANDPTCSQRDFFVHCLYFLVGDIYIRKIDCINNERINTLLCLVSDNSALDVKKWKEETIQLLNGEITFDPPYWWNHITELTGSE